MYYPYYYDYQLYHSMILTVYISQIMKKERDKKSESIS